MKKGTDTWEQNFFLCFLFSFRREGGDEGSKGNGAIKQNGDKGQNGANGVAGVSRPDIIEESIVSTDQFESVFDQAFDPDRHY